MGIWAFKGDNFFKVHFGYENLFWGRTYVIQCFSITAISENRIWDSQHFSEPTTIS
jgi:hypothetical protein